MWRRALLAAAAVSYLICVLIMSGMQKEDLDVSMLQKLRRYNVNLDDINNERIRQQCSSRNNGFTTNDRKESNEDYTSTTEYKSTVTTERPVLSTSLDLDYVFDYLKTQKESATSLGETITTGKNTHVDQKVTTPEVERIENQPKIDMDLLRRYIQLETQKKSFYKLDKNSETNKHYATINLKTNERNPNIDGNVVSIDRILKDYIFKQQKISTTSEYATPRYTIDIQNVYKQIDEMIANGSHIDNEEDKLVENHTVKDEPQIFKNKIIRPVKGTSLSQNRVDPAGKRLFESFYNFLNEMNQFKNNLSRPLPTYDENVYSKDQTQRNKLLVTFKKNVHEKKEATTDKSNPKAEPNQRSLTPLLVKEIAETVKKVIIKDLRNELTDIYLKTTPKTTQVIPTRTKTTTDISLTTTTSRKTTQDMSIMDKFMDLFEQIKSLKEATFLMGPKNKTSTFVKDFDIPNKAPLKSEILLPIANLLPSVNTLQIPDNKVSISSVGNYNLKPFFNYNSYIPRKENNRAIPITIQTNSVEIRPLAIPLSKPENLIRQNIVVHPKYRNNFQGRDDHLKQYSSRGNRYSDSDIPIKYKNTTFKYSPFKRYDGYNSARYPLHNLQEPKNKEDIIRFRVRDNGNSRLDTDYYEKINFRNDHNGVKEKHRIINNGNIPKFHERLERVDTGSDGTSVVSDSDMTGKQEQSADFPSRYQLPLVDMKKGTSYDDSHFKNFLKTQQKVTDMLERILATRSKTNTPRSVEAV